MDIIRKRYYPKPLITLQQKQGYQAPEKSLVCENNHNRPNLAFIVFPMVPSA